METEDDAARIFEANRAHVFAVAYRMLGTRAEAEDATQDAFLRWREVDRGAVREPRAWLTTTVVRLCLDQLGSARARRESYVGPWLAEPLFDPNGTPPRDPMERVALRESASLAFLRVLDALSPKERAVFLLREVFEMSFEEIAESIGAAEDACRKTHQRAREHVAAGRKRKLPMEERMRLTQSFLVACATGDLDALSRMLTDDAVSISDGGGKVRAARNVVTGRLDVAKLFLGLSKKPIADLSVTMTIVGDDPAVVVRSGAHLEFVLVLEFDGDRVASALTQLNPDKLSTFSCGAP